MTNLTNRLQVNVQLILTNFSVIRQSLVTRLGTLLFPDFEHLTTARCFNVFKAVNVHI